MPKSPIARMELSFLAHATEDQEKVMKAFQNVVSTECAEKISVTKGKLEGEYGNPIILFRAKVQDETITESILKHVAQCLPTLDKEKLFQELNLHLEEGSLYLRFDKQVAFKGKLRLFREDPVHLRIRFRTKKAEEITGICKDLGLLPNLQAS